MISMKESWKHGMIGSLSQISNNTHQMNNFSTGPLILSMIQKESTPLSTLSLPYNFKSSLNLDSKTKMTLQTPLMIYFGPELRTIQRIISCQIFVRRLTQTLVSQNLRRQLSWKFSVKSRTTLMIRLNLKTRRISFKKFQSGSQPRMRQLMSHL